MIDEPLGDSSIVLYLESYTIGCFFGASKALIRLVVVRVAVFRLPATPRLMGYLLHI